MNIDNLTKTTDTVLARFSHARNDFPACGRGR